MKVKDAVEEYMYANLRKSQGTQRWYKIRLKFFTAWCEQQGLELENIKAAHVNKYLEYRSNQISYTGKPLSSYTLAGDAQVIKSFLFWCSKEDGIEDLVSERVPRRVEMPRVEQKVIEIFTREQTDALFAVCEKEITTQLAVRDRAILSVLLDTGIRANELCSLTLDYVYLDPQEAYLRVHGKGNKWREVGLGKKARAALHRYISRYRQAEREEKHLFVNRHGKQMTVNGIDQMLERLAQWARIRGVRCTAHTFRHTFAVRYLEKSRDVYKLSRLMGHSHVRITELYLNAVNAREVRNNSISVLDDL